MTRALHVTNGDAAAAALRESGIGGELLPWRDVLHDGPVPAEPWERLRETRARYVASCGWAGYEVALADFITRDARLDSAVAHGDAITLWFEHDLYDQLQLVQLLTMLGAHVRGGGTVQLAQASDYLGGMDADAVTRLGATTTTVTAAQVALAERTWAAFTSAMPDALRALAASDTAGGATGDTADGWALLPFLRPALHRLLEEHPDRARGLSRTERQALEALAAGDRTIGSAYVAAHHATEEPIWLGDASFARYLAALSEPPGAALVEFADGGRITSPAAGDGSDDWSRPVRLTVAGRDVLEGRANRIALRGIDRWIGGVHLHQPPTT